MEKRLIYKGLLLINYVSINLDSTVGAFKMAIAEKSEVPVEQQRLIYKGRILKDDQTLESYATEDVAAEYYQQQVEMLDGFNEMNALTDPGFLQGMSKEEQEKLARSETTAIRISNIAKMVFFAAKVYASVRSGSLAIIASTLDSLLDLLSDFILWFTAFSMQPLGILVFASVMATLGLQIILESIRTLAWITLRARESIALGRKLLGGNEILADFLVAKVFCDLEPIFTYEGTYDINSPVTEREVTGNPILEMYKKAVGSSSTNMNC